MLREKNGREVSYGTGSLDRQQELRRYHQEKNAFGARAMPAGAAAPLRPDAVLRDAVHGVQRGQQDVRHIENGMYKVRKDIGNDWQIRTCLCFR